MKNPFENYSSEQTPESSDQNIEKMAIEAAQNFKMEEAEKKIAEEKRKRGQRKQRKLEVQEEQIRREKDRLLGVVMKTRSEEYQKKLAEEALKSRDDKKNVAQSFIRELVHGGSKALRAVLAAASVALSTPKEGIALETDNVKAVENIKSPERGKVILSGVTFGYNDKGDVVSVEHDLIENSRELLNDDYKEILSAKAKDQTSFYKMQRGLEITAEAILSNKEILNRLVAKGQGESPEAKFLEKKIQTHLSNISNSYGNVIKAEKLQKYQDNLAHEQVTFSSKTTTKEVGKKVQEKSNNEIKNKSDEEAGNKIVESVREIKEKADKEKVKKETSEKKDLEEAKNDADELINVAEVAVKTYKDQVPENAIKSVEDKMADLKTTKVGTDSELIKEKTESLLSAMERLQKAKKVQEKADKEVKKKAAKEAKLEEKRLEKKAKLEKEAKNQYFKDKIIVDAIADRVKEGIDFLVIYNLSNKEMFNYIKGPKIGQYFEVGVKKDQKGIKPRQYFIFEDENLERFKRGVFFGISNSHIKELPSFSYSGQYAAIFNDKKGYAYLNDRVQDLPVFRRVAKYEVEHGIKNSFMEKLVKKEKKEDVVKKSAPIFNQDASRLDNTTSKPEEKFGPIEIKTESSKRIINLGDEYKVVIDFNANSKGEVGINIKYPDPQTPQNTNNFLNETVRQLEVLKNTSEKKEVENLNLDISILKKEIEKGEKNVEKNAILNEQIDQENKDKKTINDIKPEETKIENQISIEKIDNDANQSKEKTISLNDTTKIVFLLNDKNDIVGVKDLNYTLDYNESIQSKKLLKNGYYQIISQEKKTLNPDLASKEAEKIAEKIYILDKFIERGGPEAVSIKSYKIKQIEIAENKLGNVFNKEEIVKKQEDSQDSILKYETIADSYIRDDIEPFLIKGGHENISEAIQEIRKVAFYNLSKFNDAADVLMKNMNTEDLNSLKNTKNSIERLQDLSRTKTKSIEDKYGEVFKNKNLLNDKIKLVEKYYKVATSEKGQKGNRKV